MQEKKVFDAKEVEDSFNLLVQLVRTAKLTYEEHSRVDDAVNLIFEVINDNASSQKTETIVKHLSQEEEKEEQ